MAEFRDKARRRAITLTLLVAGLGLPTGSAWAGAQREERLADAVRLTLATAISDNRPPRNQFDKVERQVAYNRWIQAAAGHLRRTVPDLHMRMDILETVWYEARRAGLEPTLVLGLIQVESNFRKYAISNAGARGLMQVMPFWTRVIGDGDARKLFHMQTNLRYGCVILRHYLDIERGDLYMALGRYNGSRGRPEYPRAVLAAWDQWRRITGEG